MSGKLRVGIAGYGVVGQRRRRVVDQRDDMAVVAVCDRRLGDAIPRPDVPGHLRYQDLLNEGLDVLVVCMSNDIAAEVTVAGLVNGLHVFCEKPPGRDLADVAKVVAAEKRHPGLKLKYGFNHRYHELVRDALRIVGSGELGRVINLKGTYGKSQLITFNQTSWRTERALAGGGVLLDQGIHMVDLLRLFAGDFAEIHAFVSNRYWNYDVEDNAYALMRTKDGVVAMLHSSATQWRHRFHLEITLDKGAVTLAGILSGSKSYGAETLTVARTGGDDVGDPREETVHYNSDPSWELEIAEFADAVTNGRPIVNGSSDEALKTMELVYRIYRADPEWKRRWNLSDDVPFLP